MTRNVMTLALVAMLAAASGCSPQAEAGSDAANEAARQAVGTAAPAAAAPDLSAWAGKWVGVEGMFVEITPAADGTFTLTMKSDLDTEGTYVGKPVEGGIAFERGGQELLLKAASGDETGLKYLAGKRDCLMVAPGEGYCRD